MQVDNFVFFFLKQKDTGDHDFWCLFIGSILCILRKRKHHEFIDDTIFLAWHSTVTFLASHILLFLFKIRAQILLFYWRRSTALAAVINVASKAVRLIVEGSVKRGKTKLQEIPPR